MKENKKQKKSLKDIKMILDLLKDDKFKMIAAFTLVFISSIFSLSNGYLQGEVAESIIALKIKEALLYLALYFILCGFLDNILRNIGIMIASRIESNVSRKLSLKLYKKALCLPAYAFEEKTSGELINRISSDTEALSYNFNSIIQIAINTLGCVLLLVYIFINSWIVGLEIIFFVFIILFILKLFNPKIKRINKELKEQKDSFTAISTESIRGIREIKTLGIKKHLSEEVSGLRHEIFNKDLEDIRLHRGYSIVMSFTKTLFEVTIFGTCLVLIYFGQASISFFMAMTWYVYKYTWLIENLTSMNRMFQKLYVSLKRINEIIDNTLYEDDSFGNVKLNNPKGNITFKNVTFGYKNEDVTLKDFNVTFETNKKIAVVGKSGQGKSTLFNLITRIFDPIKGEIYLDDVKLTDLTEDDLRRHISVIRQEPFLFNRTIKDNFKIVDPKITLKKIKNYCKLAYLDEYIESLPKKYDTLLGEGGVNLSGGQKQRLSIARSLAKKSKIILFDEATSALDNKSQSYIKKVIDNLAKDHTVIVIAHRLSTIVDSDIIYLVDKGKIEASGTHNELIKTSKVYKDLYFTEN